MNKVFLCGRLVREPEVRYSQNNVAVARYTLAVDRKYKKEGEPSTDFIGCVAFGKSGEFADKYLHKGIKIIVGGYIQTGSYTNKDGQKVYTTDVIVDEHEFAESKSASQFPTTQESPNAQSNSTDDFMKIPDDIGEELPFT